MEPTSLISSLGPSAACVVVVLLFLRAGTKYMKNERTHREMVAKQCHDVQTKATEATFKAIETIDRNSKAFEKLNTTLIRMNGTGGFVRT